MPLGPGPGSRRGPRASTDRSDPPRLRPASHGDRGRPEPAGSGRDAPRLSVSLIGIPVEGSAPAGLYLPGAPWAGSCPRGAIGWTDPAKGVLRLSGRRGDGRSPRGGERGKAFAQTPAVLPRVAERGGLAPGVTTALDGSIDVQPSSLVGGVVVAVSPLIGAVNAHPADLGRGVRALLRRRRVGEECQQGGDPERCSTACWSGHGSGPSALSLTGPGPSQESPSLPERMGSGLPHPPGGAAAIGRRTSGESWSASAGPEPSRPARESGAGGSSAAEGCTDTGGPDCCSPHRSGSSPTGSRYPPGPFG